MRVFVARSGWDVVAVGDALRSLESGSPATWQALEQIEPRDDWAEVAARRIREADALLFVTSPASVSSKPCLLELQLALEMDRPCWQWRLRDVPSDHLPAQLRALPVIAVGADVDASTWFNWVK